MSDPRRPRSRARFSVEIVTYWAEASARPNSSIALSAPRTLAIHSRARGSPARAWPVAASISRCHAAGVTTSKTTGQ